MQIPSHTSMHLRLPGFALIAALLLLPAPAQAEVRVVPVSSFAKHSALQSQAAQISPASLAATMETIRYKGEGLLSGVFTSGKSKIDKLFSDDSSAPVFNSEEVRALSTEISHSAAKLESGQAIAFITHASRIKGYVFFSDGKSIWYLANIDGNPAHKVEQVEDPSYLPDDPDVKWQNKVEKSYWTLVPQQGQRLLSNRRDLLMAPIAEASEAAAPAPIAAPAAKPAPDVADSDHWGRIERLRKLLDRELISKPEYNEKLEGIMDEFGEANPSIEAQLDLLKQLKEKAWVDEATYQTRREKLLEKL